MLGQKLPYDSLGGLRAALFKADPHLARIDQIAPAIAADIEKLAAGGTSTDKAPFRSPSPTSISPIRSRARPPSWLNARRLRVASAR